MSKTPDRFYIDQNDKDIYKEIEKNLFNNKDNKDLFIFAISEGFKLKKRKKLKSKYGFVRREYLTPGDWAFIYAVAIDTEGIEVLLKMDRVFEIAEEYAHSGIILIKNRLSSIPYGDELKKIEQELIDNYENLINE